MLRIFATIIGLGFVTSASAATVTVSSSDSFTINNTSYVGFSSTFDVTADAEFPRGLRLGPVTTTTVDETVTGFVNTPLDIDFSVSFMGETKTQSLSFNLLTRNNATGPGAKGGQSNLSLLAPTAFVFSDGTFTIDRFIASVNCNGCDVGTTRGSNALLEARLASPVPSAVPLPAGAGLLLAALGGLGLLRRRKGKMA